MAKSSFLILSLCIYFLSCVAASADLTAFQKDKLDQALASYEKKKPIHSVDDQLGLIQDSSKFLKSKIFSFGEMAEVLKWSRVLLYLSDYPNKPMIEPERNKGETQEAFTIIYDKFMACEALRKDLVLYLRDKYPLEPLPTSGACAMEVNGTAPSVAFEKLKVSVADVADHMDVGQKHEGAAPVITAADIFAKYYVSREHDGFSVHMEGLQFFRGDVGGDGSRGKIVTAFSDPILNHTPLYPLNEKPVVLTATPASQAFFKGLPKEMLTTNGEWEGFRYDFVPSSLIYTGPYTDPESRAPIPFFFMRKVKSEANHGDSENTSNAELELGKLEEAVKENLRSNDLLQAALMLRQGAQWDVPLTEAVYRYLVAHPELGHLEMKEEGGGHLKARDEMNRLERLHQQKLKAHEVTEKATNAALMKQYFPQGEQAIAAGPKRSRLHSVVIAELKRLMSSSTEEIKVLEETLKGLRIRHIEKIYPGVKPADLAMKFLIALAEPRSGHGIEGKTQRGLARAQYELARLRSEGKTEEIDLEKAKEYAALAFSQGFPAVDFRPGKVTVTGVKYLLDSDHPILGKTWEDPRGLK